MTKLPEEIYAEARAFASTFTEARVMERMTLRLAQHPGPVMHEGEAAAGFRDHLVGWVREDRPLSLIRLGDGEGNVLFWERHREDLPRLAKQGMQRIWHLTFGRRSPAAGAWASMATRMSTAAVNATHVGIPTGPQISDRLSSLFEDPIPEVGGTVGTVAVWDWLLNHRPELPGADQVVLRWHMHIALLDCYVDIVAAAGNLSVVTCYPELLGLLASQCGVSAGESILIPPQAINLGTTPSESHYPEAADRIIDELEGQNLSGKLFFVGAGLPGKAYCETIRASGGMAIDVGSMADVWVGRGVRPYQSDEFVGRHRLGAP